MGWFKKKNDDSVEFLTLNKEVSQKLNNIETFYKKEKGEISKDYETIILDLLNQLGKNKNDSRKRQRKKK